MKRLLSILALVLALASRSVSAQDADEQYIRIYNLMVQADALSGQPAEAMAKYGEALAALQRFQKINPDWNPKVVNFRLNYLSAKVAEASYSAPAQPAAQPTTALPAKSAPAATATPAPISAPVPELERKLAGLEDEVQRLSSANSLLEAKLKEALAAKPATADPRELEKAEKRVQDLLKDNDLLKASLAAEKNKPPSRAESRELEKARQAQAESARKLVEQTELAARLSRGRESLQARIKTLTDSAEGAEALRAENRLLKKQIADLKAAPPPEHKSAELQRRLSQAETQIAALKSDAEILRLEKIALEGRVKTLTAVVAAPKPAALVVATPPPAAPPASRPEDLQRIKFLEAERTDLLKKLGAATKQLGGRKGAAAAAKVENLSNQIAALRARLEVFEARAVPYTAEELALLSKPQTVLVPAPPKATRKSVKELPPGAVSLVAEAQRDFAAKRLDQAEDKYLQVLRQDEGNVNTLANLAAIQLERGKLGEAEKNITKAVAGAPDDAYSLSILGNLRYRQEKFDEALAALSRAAKLSPQSAEIQNFLGVTLSHKGLRASAETALRKAIQLDPNYGAAHQNLAVIYASQQPPALELARWHYQKALAAGQERNADLEKSLDEKAGSPASK